MRCRRKHVHGSLVAAEACNREQDESHLPADDVAIDSDGRSLPYTNEEVQGIVAKAMREGTILAVIVEMPNGDLAVPVMGPPSEKLAEALEHCAKAYRTNLRGH